jgi:hypothetical protein
MRLLAANILSFELDPGQGVPTAPGVPSTVLIAPKRSLPQNRCKRSDRAVAFASAGMAAAANQDIAGSGQISGRKFAGSRFDRTVRVRHEGIDKEAG